MLLIVDTALLYMRLLYVPAIRAPACLLYVPARAVWMTSTCRLRTQNSLGLDPFSWIHGGNDLTGSGAEARYNATDLVALLRDVVVVTLNYRLGVLGFLGGEQMRTQSSSGSVGNYGLQDQRLAMQWVQRNIAAFGGDPSRVLLLGESSGAGCVSCHLVARKSDGLFRTAGMSSGAFGTWTTSAWDDAQAGFDQMLQFTNCGNGTHRMGSSNSSTNATVPTRTANQSIACLRNTPLPKLFEAAKQVNTMGFGPTVDGRELADLPIALLRQGRYNQEPTTAVKAIMVGSMAEDSYSTVASNANASAFESFVRSQYLFGDYVNKAAADAVWQRLAPLYNSTAASSDGPPPQGMNQFNRTWDHYFWAVKHMLADAEMFCPARAAARIMSADSSRSLRSFNAFHYQFRHPLATAQAKSNASVATGAQHAGELPFMFYKTNSTLGQYLSTPGEVGLSVAFANYIRNLAATDNPATPPPPLPLHDRRFRAAGEKEAMAARQARPPRAPLPAWPRYDKATQPVMILDTVGQGGGCHAVEQYRSGQCFFWDTVPNEYVPVL